MFGITVEVCNIPLLQPRDGSRWMIMEFKRMCGTPQIIFVNLIKSGCTNMCYYCQM